MRVFDWRLAEAADLDDAFATEILRWHDALHWDAEESWRLVDEACRQGTLPGLVAVDTSGRIAGWTFFLLNGRTLEIGALNAATADVGELLLDNVLASSLAEDATSAVFFGFSTAPALDRLLASRGFAVERYLYLERETAGFVRGPEAASWRESHREAAAALLASVYDDSRARAFARDGSLGGWRDYVSQLVTTIGCGRFLPERCQLLDTGEGWLDAAVLATRIGDHTLHLPQVAVAPHARGRGLASGLVSAALASAADAGFTRATLLVGEHNAAARRIYDKLGFRETAAFVSATLDVARGGGKSLVLGSSSLVRS